MIEITDARILEIALHKISINEELSVVNDHLYYTSNDEESEILKKIFLKAFQSIAVTHEFSHEIDIELHTLRKLSKDIYQEQDFLSKSKDIHQHLQSVSKHPNIKDGELFVVKYDRVVFKDNYYLALGIYKVENKESFIETSSSKHGKMEMNYKKGIGSKRLDKACLILFTDEPYTVFTIDNTSNETDYWQNEFLKIGLRNDEVNQTHQFLTLTKSYITQQLPSDFVVNKADQIDILNRSVAYFKTHENFDKGEFEEQVFHDKEIIDSFRNFDTTYRQENKLEIADDFMISEQAVKKQARVFKSVLKLDKNFHIYIHGDRELIEQGVEKDGRKYYKIYFDKEN